MISGHKLENMAKNDEGTPFLIINLHSELLKLTDKDIDALQQATFPSTYKGLHMHVHALMSQVDKKGFVIPPPFEGDTEAEKQKIIDNFNQHQTAYQADYQNMDAADLENYRNQVIDEHLSNLDEHTPAISSIITLLFNTIICSEDPLMPVGVRTCLEEYPKSKNSIDCELFNKLKKIIDLNRFKSIHIQNFEYYFMIYRFSGSIFR